MMERTGEIEKDTTEDTSNENENQSINDSTYEKYIPEPKQSMLHSTILKTSMIETTPKDTSDENTQRNEED